MSAAYQHEKDEKVYYARLYGYAFPVKKLTPEGKPVQKTNPATGMPVFLPSGDPEFIEKMYHFTAWKTKFCADGYVCVYKVTKDTDPLIAAALEAESVDRGSEVMDESTFIKTINPELWAQMEESKRVENLLDSKDKALGEAAVKEKSLLEEVANLKKRLGGGRA